VTAIDVLIEPALDDPLARLPGYALRRAANATMGELAGRLAKLDLRISDASVLMLVRDRATVTASQIGRTLDIQRANMVPLLNRLETARLVERVPLDRKSFAIVLTVAGLARLIQLDRTVTEFEAELLAKVPTEHREHLVPALNALWRAPA
jgi:DNA-binding MarR family transcriptional regulator